MFIVIPQQLVKSILGKCVKYAEPLHFLESQKVCGLRYLAIFLLFLEAITVTRNVNHLWPRCHDTFEVV